MAEAVEFKVLRGVSKTIPELHLWTSEEHISACSGSCEAYSMGNYPGVQKGSRGADSPLSIPLQGMRIVLPHKEARQKVSVDEH